ncbi:MAG: SRPBCC family protein, partial [Bryobacteraceae bacterium]
MSERKHDLRVEINAPAAEVWKAITEGDQIVRWFAPEAKVEPGEGGSVWMSWGPGMEGAERIRIWEPDRRLSLSPGGDSPRVVDYILEANGDTTTLRLVHSGFGAGASFDEEYDSTAGGWRIFLAMLRFGLERRRGVQARNVT